MVKLKQCLTGNILNEKNNNKTIEIYRIEASKIKK